MFLIGEICKICYNLDRFWNVGLGLAFRFVLLPSSHLILWYDFSKDRKVKKTFPHEVKLLIFINSIQLRHNSNQPNILYGGDSCHNSSYHGCVVIASTTTPRSTNPCTTTSKFGVLRGRQSSRFWWAGASFWISIHSLWIL